MIGKHDMSDYYDKVQARRKVTVKVMRSEIERLTANLNQLEALCVDKHDACFGCRYTAAFKRGSLDIARMLADHRQGRSGW